MKLTKTQAKILMAAGLDPATIKLNTEENYWMSQTPRYVQTFTLYGADKCEKALASPDLAMLEELGHDDDRNTDLGLFAFCFYEKCKTCKSKKCERKTGGVG